MFGGRALAVDLSEITHHAGANARSWKQQSGELADIGQRRAGWPGASWLRALHVGSGRQEHAPEGRFEAQHHLAKGSDLLLEAFDPGDDRFEPGFRLQGLSDLQHGFQRFPVVAKAWVIMANDVSRLDLAQGGGGLQ